MVKSRLICLFLLIGGTLLLTPGCLREYPKTERIEDYPDLMRGKVVELARALTGRPYRLGGGEIDGLDCSGLVHYVFHAFGYKSPRTAREFARVKPAVRLDRLKAADVLVFKLKGSWHVGLYSGKGAFVHAPSRGQRVREEALNAFWLENCRRAVRIIRD